ncbi:SDR family NAD(P)-dependent oxidoreductase [Wenzhouxiangella sp. XN24]|uniref:SDR family NAD(P)-dependent oxidoreductase n=1 Tax=Wenzhouxiangella sp. XN24 TaxID=2713569 RepID=UPI0013EA9415|nr:SDR family NAD(P)-dependent oxidoreductase [Wenzhouxiangella sp. XN24]NGX14849.1 SDR family NAD(P)-dependent oxidoreductase [Wenzhouxiangella sp. XN24]
MELSSLKAVVSGGASGLGHAVARRIVADGGRVAILDVNEAQGREAAEKLGAAARFFRTDVSNDADVIASVDGAAEAFGGINLAVSCAGILGAGRVLGREGPMAGEYFAKVIMVNLVGTFQLAKAAAARMQHNEPNEAGERGLIVNTASVAAFEGQVGQAAYSASKAGVAGMALPLAREFARLGIRVNTIAPGIFLTPMMESMPEHIQASLAAQVPFPSRLGRPEEFADLVACICTNTMLNAETIRLDGAIRMQPK